MDLCWHGGPSFSLRHAGVELLIDPAFSRPGDYPPWFGPEHVNQASPTVDQYLERHRPGYLFITHGHFDHFDLETVRRIGAARPEMRIGGSTAVTATCQGTLGLPRERLLTLAPAKAGRDDEPRYTWLNLMGGEGPGGAVAGPPLRVRAVPGPHWFTGAAGDAVAAKLAGRPDRYGAFPCGGPMLGLIFEADAEEDGRRAVTVYVSGDTDADGFPTGPFSAAVVACGGSLSDPITRQPTPPWIDEPTLAGAVCRVLRPGVLVPIHYDHPVFLTGFDPERLAGELAAYPQPPRLLTPRYGEWVPLAG